MHFNVPFVGDLTTQLVKKPKGKLRRCLVDPSVDIRMKEKTTKLCFFTSTKDKTLPLSQSNVVYELTLPSCNSSHIRKRTELSLSTHKNMRSRTKKAPYTNVCVGCDQIKHIPVHGLCNLLDILSMRTTHLLMQ